MAYTIPIMKAVFLDRDGTIIVEPPDGRDVKFEELQIQQTAQEALELLAKNGFKVVLITNQDGISLGTLDEEEFWAVNNEMLRQVQDTNIEVLETYMCPHATADNCECRKPKPKMIIEAAQKFDIDLAGSYMVGDRLTDVQAGQQAGTKTILVKTGVVPVTSDDATYTAENLLAAAEYIVSH